VRMRSSFAFHTRSVLNCRAVISDTILAKRDSMASNRFVASALSLSRTLKTLAYELSAVANYRGQPGFQRYDDESYEQRKIEGYTYPISGYGADTRLFGHHFNEGESFKQLDLLLTVRLANSRRLVQAAILGTLSNVHISLRLRAEIRSLRIRPASAIVL